MIDSINPELGALANNGGPTETMAPALTSFVINHGSVAATASLTQDQRGLNRIVNGATDIGAYEETMSIAPTSLPQATAGTNYDQTITINGGTPPFTVAIDSFSAGTTGLTSAEITTNSSGTVTIDGTPATAGTATFTIAVTDAEGGTFSQNYSISVVGLMQTPTVGVTDVGGAYTGAAYPATATVNGQSSLEGVTPTLTYYQGNVASGTPLSGAPFSTGIYTVVAAFAGSADYTSASSSPVTFAIGDVTPSVTRVSPSNGPLAGGTVVTITGINLAYATDVAFVALAGQILSDSDTQIVAITPAE